RVLPAEPGAGATPPGHPPRQPPRQPRPASGGRPPTSPPRRSGRRRFPIVRTILLVLLAYVVFLVAVPVLAGNRVDNGDAAPAGDPPVASAGTNYLLVGSDSREGLTDEQKSEFGTGDAGGRRTDSIMLLHVPRGFGPPVLLSLP